MCTLCDSTNINTIIEFVPAVMVSVAVLIRTFKGCTYRAPIRYVTRTWSVVLLNKKKYIYSCLKCIVSDKVLTLNIPRGVL